CNGPHEAGVGRCPAGRQALQTQHVQQSQGLSRGAARQVVQQEWAERSARQRREGEEVSTSNRFAVFDGPDEVIGPALPDEEDLPYSAASYRHRRPPVASRPPADTRQGRAWSNAPRQTVAETLSAAATSTASAATPTAMETEGAAPTTPSDG